MANKDKTEIAIILDRSGSMQSICADMEGGFRSFVDRQRGEPGECVLSLYQFDDRYDVVYEAKPLSDVTALKLQPRGSTALLDGVGKSVANIAARHDALPEGERPAAVIVLVITDGQENASTEWKLADVRKAVEAAERQRNWRFVFLGADANAFADARAMGIAASAQYESSERSVGFAYDALHDAARSYRGSVRGGDFKAKVEIKPDLTDPKPSKPKARKPKPDKNTN